MVALAAAGARARGRRPTRRGITEAACRSRRRRSARVRRDGRSTATRSPTGRCRSRSSPTAGSSRSCAAPDRRGRLANITLGYEDLDGLHGPARRSADPEPVVLRRDHRPLRQPHRRAPRSCSTATTYTLDANNGPNSLHGGDQGFDRFVWDAEPFERHGVVGVKLTRTSTARRGLRRPADRRAPGYPGQPQGRGRLHARQAQQPAHRLQGDDGRADRRQPHQPRLLEPVRRGHGDDLRPPAHAQRRTATRRSTRR